INRILLIISKEAANIFSRFFRFITHYLLLNKVKCDKSSALSLILKAFIISLKKNYKILVRET
ncbi:hypothetical protein ACT3QO_15090, partial [Psychrobacter sp. AOP7-D1-15]|uniref:hypothetical protein n=2 Tax=unclassified Psychrobacter TaxID=196806 RepID=UPI00402B2092